MGLAFENDRLKWNTLAHNYAPRRRRWSFSIALSSVLHGAIVLVLCWPAAPIFVRPNALVHGEGGSATPISVVLYLPHDLQLAKSTKSPLLSLPVTTQKKAQKS